MRLHAIKGLGAYSMASCMGTLGGTTSILTHSLLRHALSIGRHIHLPGLGGVECLRAAGCHPLPATLLTLADCSRLCCRDHTWELDCCRTHAEGGAQSLTFCKFKCLEASCHAHAGSTMRCGTSLLRTTPTLMAMRWRTPLCGSPAPLCSSTLTSGSVMVEVGTAVTYSEGGS